MAVEAISLSNNDFFTLLMYETMYSNNITTDHPFKLNNTSAAAALIQPQTNLYTLHDSSNFMTRSHSPIPPLPRPASSLHNSTDGGGHRQQGNVEIGVSAAAGMRKTKKRRRRRPANACKNREEAETQRLTHIVMERNRRKQMNEHLAALRSLMPESYSQRGDQASIVGGAIEYVKELEHLVQSLQAHKLLLLKRHHNGTETETSTTAPMEETGKDTFFSPPVAPPPFSQFFSYPHNSWSHHQSAKRPIIITSNTTTTTTIPADIEVTLIETHANLRILVSRKTPRQLSKLISGFQLLNLNILHLNVTSIHTLVLYSISAKVEESCQLTSVDEIADATHQMLQMIEEDEQPQPLHLHPSVLDLTRVE